MGEPLSPDLVFDFLMNEPHPAYEYFAPAPLPEYASNPNNNNGWLSAMIIFLGSSIVWCREPVSRGRRKEQESWEVNEDWLMAPTKPPPVLAVLPPSIYEVGGPSTAVAEGPSFPQVSPGLPVPPCMIEDLSTRLDNLEYGHGQLVQRVIQGSDAKIVAGVIIGEIGLRVLAVEGKMQVRRPKNDSGLAGRCAAKRHADPAVADYCYRDEQQGEHADAWHFGIGKGLQP
ncbi:hypothetical protein Tco_0598012 [Tanacetum coccineum]